MKKNFTKLYIYLIPSVIFCAILLLGNILAINTAEARGNTNEPRTCRYTHHCNYGVITKNGISYNVTGKATYSRPCGENSFPSWGCNFVKNEILDRLGPSNLSASWGLSCGNVHSYSASIISMNGSCGSANGTPSTSFPTSNLCNVGTVSGTSTAGSTHNWTCNGLFGGGNVACSAPVPSTFALSCSVSPSTGVMNSNVTFTGQITGTSTPASSFTYTWKVNNVASTTATVQTFINRWTAPTTTAQVEVTATRGTATQKADCNFNRVDCSGGQIYCGDVTPLTSYACAAASSSCPQSACGAGYDISLDKQLALGATLSTTTPSAGYITTNNLCGSGSVLRVFGGVGQWSFNPAYSTWRWDCQNAQAVTYKTCKARCDNGEFYCVRNDKCVPDKSVCQCPLAGTSPVQYVDIQEGICLNDDGTCSGCGKVITYFKMIPDEMEKNQSVRLCGGYWNTIQISNSQKPSGTANVRVICAVKVGTTTTSVASTNPSPGTPYAMTIGAYSLTCTQQYELTASPGVWNDFQSETLDAKCRAVPTLIEK